MAEKILATPMVVWERQDTAVGDSVGGKRIVMSFMTRYNGHGA